MDLRNTLQYCDNYLHISSKDSGDSTKPSQRSTSGWIWTLEIHYSTVIITCMSRIKIRGTAPRLPPPPPENFWMDMDLRNTLQYCEKYLQVSYKDSGDSTKPSPRSTSGWIGTLEIHCDNYLHLSYKDSGDSTKPSPRSISGWVETSEIHCSGVAR